MSIKKILLTAAAVVTGTVAIASASYAQCGSIIIPEQSRVTCIIVNGQKVYVDPNGNVYSLTSNGNGTFTATSNSQNPCTQNLNVSSISATGSNATLGTVTTTLDASRPSTGATIQSNQVAAQFPATVKFAFYANATLSSKPGVNYRSVQQLSFANTNVNSFNPFKQERFTLQSKVDFEDVKQPGKVAFTLSSLTVTLN